MHSAMNRIIITEDNEVYPFGMLLNTRDSIVPFYSTVEETTVTIPGIDGETQLDSWYAAKEHFLVLRSLNGIYREEKSALLNRVGRFVAVAKNSDVEIFYKRLKRIYYARVVGEPERPKEYAGWIEFSLPLKSHDPYAYHELDSVIEDVGAFMNRGTAFAFGCIEFHGPCTNPAVTVNGTMYRYAGTVANGYTLAVDSRLSVACMVHNSTAVAANVNLNWNGNFLEIPPGKNEINAITNAKGKCKIRWRGRDA